MDRFVVVLVNNDLPLLTMQHEPKDLLNEQHILGSSEESIRPLA